MTRRHLTFSCERDTLVGTLDDSDAAIGLLIVSGGNEVRCGAFGGSADLAAYMAREGFPVFRYDRRGIGDSEGENRGFANSQEDIAAALAAFRGMKPKLRHVVAMGNCDAASALMCANLPFDAMVLTNPWTYDEEAKEGPPPAAAIRSRYIAKLRNPREVWRLLRGGVDLRKLAAGLRQAAAPSPTVSDLSREMRSSLDAFGGKTTILLAEADRTAQAFDACWNAGAETIIRRAAADHAFSKPADQAWLRDRILEVLRAFASAG